MTSLLAVTVAALATHAAGAASATSFDPRNPGPSQGYPVLPKGMSLPIPRDKEHTEFVVETNKKGQVVKVDSGKQCHDRTFNAFTYGNALQAFIRTPDGNAIPGYYKLSYDFDPKTLIVHRNVELVKAGGVNPDAQGAVDEMADVAKRHAAHEAEDAEQKAAAAATPLPDIRDITGHNSVTSESLEADAVALLERTSHAVRFAPGPLPPMALRRVLEAGRIAPSLFNTQPVRFAVVRRPADYERLTAEANRSRDTFVKGRPFFAMMNKRLATQEFVMGLERQRSGDVLPQHGTAIVTLRDDRFTESVEACACALQSMQLEATALGLASAMSSWTHGCNFRKDVVAWLRVPPGFVIFTTLVIGNPVAPLERKPKERRDFDDAVIWI